MELHIIRTLSPKKDKKRGGGVGNSFTPTLFMAMTSNNIEGIMNDLSLVATPSNCHKGCVLLNCDRLPCE